MKKIIKNFPEKSGIYLMKNSNGIIIYVGKAKNIKKRVYSYFASVKTGKTLLLINEISSIEYIITSNELEAFILEHNLIKTLNPKYNILLKDDKTYPYIQLVEKDYPELKIVRYHKKKDESNLFGPYQNVNAAKRVVSLLNRIYPLKKCKHLPKEPCLYYYIDECLGYCKFDIPKEQIEAIKKNVLDFLKGDDKKVRSILTKKIDDYSRMLEFENANALKEHLEYIDIVLAKQNVEVSEKYKLDVLGVYQKDNLLGVNILFIRSGKIVGSNFNIINIVADKKEELERYLFNFYSNHEKPKELITSEKSLTALEGVLDLKVILPKRGIKLKLLEMSNMNAKSKIREEYIKHKNFENITIDANNELGSILNINIKKIEAFDSSNLFGSSYVGVVVAYENGIKSSKNYRKFKLNLTKPDDVRALKELIYRRYSRAIETSEELPDLIVLDGGVNQINAAREVVRDLNLGIKLIALKKDAKHKTNKVIDGESLDEIKVSKNVFNFLANIQEEVHRFAIGYHINMRDKKLTNSFLDTIKGIGKKRKTLIMQKFKRLDDLKNATIIDLEKILPSSIAEELYNYLKDIK